MNGFGIILATAKLEKERATMCRCLPSRLLCTWWCSCWNWRAIVSKTKIHASGRL